MNDRTCSIEGCGEKHKARGWCETHYRCWQRTGDPIPQHVYEKDKPCKIDGCPNKRYGRGWCNRHYKAWWQHGDPLAVDSRPVTYLAAHKRVYRARGQAAVLPCVDCGQPAAEWSYRHGCADERVGEPRPGLMAAFCVHPEHYDPRCKSCHGIYDAA